ncbi:hypothetical protein [Sphingobacterium anhuiense]|uniref:Uncharacterized protein n=1 Tax=Sphingobacterium anhuiense TaxID=493780 RepID=A0ABW5YQ53_9SPHI
MWSLILYFLFGIGQPSSSQPAQGNPTMQTSGYDDPDDGDGGDKGNIRP